MPYTRTDTAARKETSVQRKALLKHISPVFHVIIVPFLDISGMNEAGRHPDQPGFLHLGMIHVIGNLAIPDELPLMKGKKIQNFLYTCTVAASLLSLSIYTLTREPTESSLSENRMLASVKNLGDTSYADGTFQAGVENALSDQFPYREEIVRLKKKEERKFTVVQAPPEPITVLHKMPDINVYELGTSDRMINGVGEYSQEKADRYAARADQINKLSIRHPQAAIYVYYPTQVNETSLFDKDNNITAAGPQMIQLLQNTLTVPFKTLDIPDIETYERLFFMFFTEEARLNLSSFFFFFL